MREAQVKEYTRAGRRRWRFTRKSTKAKHTVKIEQRDKKTLRAVYVPLDILIAYVDEVLGR